MGGFSMKSTKLCSVLLFSLALITFLTLTGNVLAADDVYKIGAIFSTTGTGSSLGIPEKNTIEMLVNEINAAGGIKGKKIEAVIYDDASDETNARNKASKLINDDKVSVIIGPTVSGSSLAIIDTVQNAKIPLISCAASVKIVEPIAERYWVFKTPQSDVLVAQRIVLYLKAKKLTKVAIITVKNPFGASGKEQLEKLLPDAKIEIVAKEEFNDKDTDTLTQMTKIKGANPQAIICWSTSPGASLVTRNMKQELKMDIPLIMSHGVANKEYITLSGDSANGIVFPAGKLPIANVLPKSDPQKATLVKYVNDYKAKYGSEPSTFGGHAYDAFKLVVEAMKKVGNDPAKIRDEIEKTKKFIGTGGVFSFSTTDHNGLKSDCLVMVKIENGKWVIAK
jgi:branched-chain amino acid transport system substrate-binding protein